MVIKHVEDDAEWSNIMCCSYLVIKYGVHMSFVYSGWEFNRLIIFVVVGKHKRKHVG